MTRIRAALFDIDGTLLDSNDAHAHAWLDALRGYGKNVPIEVIRSKIGMGGDKLVTELAGVDADSEAGRWIAERRSAIFKAHYVPDLGPVPGARALVDRLRSLGLAIAAVTSSRADELDDLLRAAAVADLFPTSVTAEDVDRTKPDGDPVEVALERLGMDPSEALLVGDTPYDVAAGERAGVAVIAFRSGGHKDEELAGAIRIYDGPADLAAHLADSPFMQGIDEVGLPRGRGRRPAAPRGL